MDTALRYPDPEADVFSSSNIYLQHADSRAHAVLNRTDDSTVQHPYPEAYTVSLNSDTTLQYPSPGPYIVFSSPNTYLQHPDAIVHVAFKGEAMYSQHRMVPRDYYSLATPAQLLPLKLRTRVTPNIPLDTFGTGRTTITVLSKREWFERSRD